MTNGEMTKDFWIENGLTQPKLEVAEYVESMGIPVPPRYETLADALEVVSKGGTIILRSEHPGDYEAASGLAESVVVDQRTIDYGQGHLEEYEIEVVDTETIRASSRTGFSIPKGQGGPGYGQVESMIIGNILTIDPDQTVEQLLLLKSLTTEMARYAWLNEQPLKPFLDQSSYSFWEVVEGTNLTIVADDVVDGQYHAFALNSTERPTRYDGVILKGGEPIRTSVGGSGQFTPELANTVIEMYEKVRNLPRFASDHCPIMELQIDNTGKAWFLQYHRSRDFKPNTESLDPANYPEEEGWIKANGVRGSIGELAVLKTALWYPDNYKLPCAEDASADFHYDTALSDLLSPRRRVFFSDTGWSYQYAKFAASHDQRTRWFRPEAAITLGHGVFTGDLIGDELRKDISHTIHREGKMVRVVLEAAADGTNGYVRMKPGVEQPEVTDS